MKKTLSLTVAAIAAISLLAGCGADKTAIKDETPTQAKVESQPAKETKAAEPATTKEGAAPVEAEKKPDDIWTYYNDAKWTDTWNGVTSTIEKVVVTDRAPKDGNTNDLTASAVGVKFKVENTTKKLFTTYPDQAELITSTGEQVQADMVTSDHIGGEIEEGVIKDGNIIWFLKRGHAADIKWIKMKWYVIEGNGMEPTQDKKEYSVKLELK
ncbi:hypothetical protein [Paenibacillus ottowii]|uniref:Lipoprotein n=1 Tax=Paenibacillus ottowii TaxID=2315729 RepID=A0ABY3BD48_9BACL|nr:hypothetical protein [Paenibacillus ottowii]TQS01392.1 hypothetical protein FKV70_03400 [Paenibacillus ottowii]TQS01447.1 hypothetical protein FKV70_03690 [Paenibacillus ottowii]